MNPIMVISMGKKTYRYDTVAGDPLKARIYQLDNGLKVFLSVYHDAPRVQTYIAVHTGSKMDPPETTGLAHYFEHMMFKGTESYGTTDWSREQVLIARIEDLFENYRKEKDETKRARIYREIDSLSYEASKFAIPNEYDKMMDAIGSQGSNAGTSSDYTIYMENIPSNEIENWAIIQSDRFSKPVLRLFHTELETVYEEKNMSLTNDNRKVSETIMKVLFPNHPYGTQTTLGEAEHLKNPSMKNIEKFFDTYYVPNNMAVCMSGEFDPDSVILILDKYFGSWQNKPVEPLKYNPWKPLDKPVYKDVTGLEAEYVRIGYGFDIRANADDALLADMIGTILSNGKAGLIDRNLSQTQKVLNPSGYTNQLTDYAMIVLGGRPVTGQTLEQVRDLLLQQVELLKKGDFPDWLVEAAVNNAQYSLMKQYESNQGRAMAMANTYLDDIPYEKYVKTMDRMSHITKKEVVDFANRFMGDGYVVVYKKQGKPEEVAKIAKPPITPVYINRDNESEFLKKIRESKVSEISPVFIDYDKDIRKLSLKGNTRLLYMENDENRVFQLTYYFRTGKNSDRILNFALTYLPYLGTSTKSLAQLNEEFYRLACTFSINTQEEETQVTLTGLSDNFEKALSLLEEILTDPKPDTTALRKLVNNTLKARKNAKSNQNEIFNALTSYGIYGSRSPYKNILSEQELLALTANDLIQRIRDLHGCAHQVLYYGPEKEKSLINLLEKYHSIPDRPDRLSPPVIFPELETGSNKVLFVQYDAKQSRLESVIRNGKFDPALSPVIALYNNYFGSNIVFQELREKRALAYTAYSRYQEPVTLDRSYLSIGYIATQNDKVLDAFGAFNELFDNLPQSDITFTVSKNTVLNKIRTDRISRMNIIWNFLNAEKLGLKTDIREDVFRKVSGMTQQDLVLFNAQFIKNRTKTYLVLGRENEVDLKGLEKFGPVTTLTLEDIFGY